MLESIFASLIANMLWHEMKPKEVEKKIDMLEQIVIHNKEGIEWRIDKRDKQ